MKGFTGLALSAIRSRLFLSVACVGLLASMNACTCSKQSGETKPAAAGEKQEAAATVDPSDAPIQGVDVARKAIALNLLDEPKDMDPQKASDQIALTTLSHVMEGLLTLDPQSKPVPGVAESFTMKDPTTYIFKLRKNAVWSDGKRVTAGDFVYGWRRAVDPKTASQYAFIVFYVKNGAEINAGHKPVTDLGVKAVDDDTLEVTLENPTGFFPRLVTFPTYYPNREDFVTAQGEKYASDADKFLFNGPFIIAEWKHNASLRLVKSDTYWAKDQIQLNEINHAYLIKDVTAEFNMFKAGKYAMMEGLSKEVLPDAINNKMQIKKYNPGTVWYLLFNAKRSVLANKNFRKALQIAFNRNEFATQVNGIPGTKPAYGIIPDYMPGVEKTFGEEFPSTFKDADLVQAKALLEKAKKELGITEFPELAILSSDSDTARIAMEYVQRYYKQNLGINLKLDFQTFKVRLERTDRSDFDICFYGWGPDYLDAMTFADLFSSWNENNKSGWNVVEKDKSGKTIADKRTAVEKKYDELVTKALKSADAKVRMKAMADANKILIDEAPISGMYQQARVWVVDPRLTGVVRRAVGADPDFRYASVTDSVANK